MKIIKLPLKLSCLYLFGDTFTFQQPTCPIWPAQQSAAISAMPLLGRSAPCDVVSVRTSRLSCPNSDFYEQSIRNIVLTVWENVASWHSRQNKFQTPPLSRTSPLGTQKSARLAWGHIILISLCSSISYLLLFPRTNPAILNRSCTARERFLLASVLQSLTKM